MKQWYLGITFVSIAFFQSMSAYRITLTPDSDLGSYEIVRIIVDVDGKRSSALHQTPMHFLEPGQSAAWNQNTIRKEFGKKSKKVNFTFIALGDVPPKGQFYKKVQTLGKASFNLGDNIKVKVTNITKPRDPHDISLEKPKFEIKAWTE